MKPILMSRDNPTGHKLEELLQTVRNEVADKCLSLAHDPSYTAQVVLRNNRRIMDLLYEAENVQRESLLELDRLGPDQGPTGKPRVGVGSGNPVVIHMERVTRG